MSEVITGAVILAVPGLGFLCLAYTFLHYLVHGAGFGEQRAGQYDFQHIVIATLVSGFFNMALFSQLNWTMAIQCFMFSAPVFFIQLLVARIDAQRFQAFLKDKVAEQIESTR
ncbi:hypothetical protein [Pseudomonas putida]